MNAFAAYEILALLGTGTLRFPAADVERKFNRNGIAGCPAMPFP